MNFYAMLLSLATLVALVHAGYLSETQGYDEHDDDSGATALYGDISSHHQASEESLAGASDDGFDHLGHDSISYFGDVHDFADSYPSHGVSLSDFTGLSGGYEHAEHRFAGELQQAVQAKSHGFDIDFDDGAHQFDSHSDFSALGVDDFKFESDTGGQSEWKPIHGWN